MRHAIRSLSRSPGLVVVSVLSLGLGLGVNLAVFSAIQAVFFYEPTLADPSRVYAVQPGNSNQFSYLNYRDLLGSGIVETAAGSRGVTLNLRSGTETERVDALAVTANFFEFVGIPVALGRSFHRSRGDARAAAARRGAQRSVLATAVQRRPRGDRPRADHQR